MRISDWSSDVCSSDLVAVAPRVIRLVVALAIPMLDDQHMMRVMLMLDDTDAAQALEAGGVFQHGRYPRANRFREFRLDDHVDRDDDAIGQDRKSTRLNSSH